MFEQYQSNFTTFIYIPCFLPLIFALAVASRLHLTLFVLSINKNTQNAFYGMVILIWIINKFAYYLERRIECVFGKIVRTNTLYLLLHPRLHFILDSDEENFCWLLEYIYFEFEIFVIKFYYQISSEVRFYREIDFGILLLNYPEDFNIKLTLESTTVNLLLRTIELASRSYHQIGFSVLLINSSKIT